MTYNLNQEQFSKLYQHKQNLILFQTLLNDNICITSVFKELRICYDTCFLFESNEKNEDKGRFSLIGLDPDKIWRCKDNQAFISNDGGAEFKKDDSKIVKSFRNFINLAQIDYSQLQYNNEELPMMSGGVFGYMNYDMIKFFENSINTDHQIDEIDIADSIYIRPQILIIFDNLHDKILICSPLYSNSKNISYEQITSKIATIKQKIVNCKKNKLAKNDLTCKVATNFKSSHSEEQYCKIVKKCQEYIAQGDIFQVLPSQRFYNEFSSKLDKFEFYLILRAINPSPFLFFLQFSDFVLCGSSPEIMASVKNNTITVRPLAGTRKRGTNPSQDKIIAKELLLDKKEIAEHLMLIDLGRHDVGRVSKKGSIKVTKKMIIEYYSHVMHISSNIEGVIDDKFDALDVLISAFPAGTVSGAPKIRAMEIIAKLEKIKRSFYSGCVGYFSANNNMESCITLRSALIKNDKIYIQSGAGIVYDSKPEAEYQECINKAQALIKAYNILIS